MKDCNARELQRDLRAQGNKERAKVAGVFFKTGKGQYAEGDIFLGLTVPQVRAAIKPYRQMPLQEVDILLSSKYHEERLAALVILVHQSQKGDDEVRGKLCAFYLKRTKHINNWDLVDVSARVIVGRWIRECGNQAILRTLAGSKSLWERRIAMVATHDFILAGDVKPTMTIAKMLLADDHDLIHKATGWMLREAGKKDSRVLVDFLRAHHARLPRTTLRYAIEHFSADRRARMLKGDYS